MPLLLFAFLAGGSFFIGLKWRAAIAQSRVSREASTGPAMEERRPSFGVDAGRSGGGV
jgi:hypothetical protein